MTKSLVLQTTELKQNRAPAFHNGDDRAISKPPMTSRKVAQMAFRAVYENRMGSSDATVLHEETNR